MASLVHFFLNVHDVRFVALAALVCLVSAYACVSLMRHAHRLTGRLRWVWHAVSALSVGFGIWATHFVAVLAFRPGFEFSYDIGLTAVSLLIAVLICGAGLTLVIFGSGRRDHLLGGAVVGVGISSMHYVGIAALVMGGTLRWDPSMVTASVLAGIILSALAVMAAMGRGWRGVTLGALLLTLAICAMHFTAMGAADFSLCFPLMFGNSQINGGILAVVVAVISLLLLAAALGAMVLDEADRRRTAREQARELADAERLNEMASKLQLAITNIGHGLALFGADGRLQISNRKLLDILSLPADLDLTGLHLERICELALATQDRPSSDTKLLAHELAERHLDLSRRGGGEAIEALGANIVLRIRHSAIDGGAWVTTVEDISEDRRREAAITHMAQHDALTGLPNRARFDQLLDVALRDAEGGDDNLAVIAIDLDGFKEINDTYGHEAGDHVLINLAEGLTRILREGEVVGRVGGDEFSAFKPFTNMDALRDFLQRIESTVSGRVPYGDVELATGGSIGVAIYPDDGADRSKLLSNADLAMYRAKADFDQRVCYYESEMDEYARQRRAMARDIWTALEEDAFTLVYQVQRSVSTSEVTGYEVLIRWDRPGFGPVSPADFIPVAEECGAIAAIGAWVLKTACREAAAWPEPHKIAVNVSGLQLAQLELVDMVRMVLFQSGLAPERLELEVTETAIIADKKRALHILRLIKTLGVSIAIDDFGTGYSSLDTLRSFPFDKIKLDRSFMSEVETNEQSKAIVRAILALGRSLSVPVLAEGVETSAQFDVLREEGCNEAQGFLLGRPGRIDWSDYMDVSLRA
ncbi:MAG: EAL domain-containing protein [Devosia sp.]|uniref:EAL domain-containing protein n=1 Tax=Devosia sp. TaxID=1871048 RepID=UPI0024CC1CDE|nr:EAL domain-containing protein [Devosia sp.]UYN99616.1 MAG: EAL domain-containing protein [Devosia sp.]